MRKHEINLRSGKKSLYGIFWQADNPIAATILVHGFGEHIARYQHVAQKFAENNISVIGVDLPGHGKSKGKRGVVNSIYDFFDCIDSEREYLRENGHDLPLILYGHSMGGNIVANYLIHNQDKQVCCALITSPWLKLVLEPSWFQLFLANTMNSIYPSLQQSAPLDVKEISSVVEVQNDYANDPLIHDKVSVRLFNEIYKKGISAINNASKIQVPVLVAHGDADAITSHKASKEFTRNGTGLEFKLWPDLRHETHNEKSKDDVIKFYVDWVSDKLS